MAESVKKSIFAEALQGATATFKVRIGKQYFDAKKLSVGQTKDFQERANAISKRADDGEEIDPEENLNLLIALIRMAIPDASEMEDEDFYNVPFDTVESVANDIMKKSGLTGRQGNS